MLVLHYVFVAFLGLVLGLVIGNIYKSKYLFALLVIAAVVLGVYIQQTQPAGSFLNSVYLITYVASALICLELSNRKRRLKEYENPISDL